jgi:hypothetical protein
MGAIEGNRPCSDNDWETITKGGESKIKAWIASQMSGKSCVVVLIGSNTAGRKWINYEIIKGWNDGKGVVGVYVHHLKDSAQKQSTKGANPFSKIPYGDSGRKLSSVVKAYDPPYTTSAYTYTYIKNNLAVWVEEAISIRNGR